MSAVVCIGQQIVLVVLFRCVVAYCCIDPIVLAHSILFVHIPANVLLACFTDVHLILGSHLLAVLKLVVFVGCRFYFGIVVSTLEVNNRLVFCKFFQWHLMLLYWWNIKWSWLQHDCAGVFDIEYKILHV